MNFNLVNVTSMHPMLFSNDLIKCLLTYRFFDFSLWLIVKCYAQI